MNVDNLCNACCYGNTQIASNIMKTIDKEQINNYISFLCTACYFNHIDIVKMFISKGIDVNTMRYRRYKFSDTYDVYEEFEQKPSCLYISCLKGNYEIANILINNGAIIDNEHDYQNNNICLHAVCQFGYLDIAKLLINNGADIHKKNKHDVTCLHEACENGNYEIVEFLLSLGAKVNARDNCHYTCLHLACYNNHFNIIKLLIEKSSYECINECINDKDLHGKTGLHILCENVYSGCSTDKIDIINFMIDNGANIYNRDMNNDTPYDNAKNNSDIVIMNVLDKAMKKKCYIISLIIQRDVFKHHVFKKIII